MSNNTLWTFRSVTFQRLVGGDDPRWFPRSVARTVDVIAATGTRIVDIGGIETEPLTFTATFASASALATMLAQEGLSGTLTSPTGQSGTALLVQVTPLIADGVLFRATCTWEFVS